MTLELHYVSYQCPGYKFFFSYGRDTRNTSPRLACLFLPCHSFVAVVKKTSLLDFLCFGSKLLCIPGTTLASSPFQYLLLSKNLNWLFTAFRKNTPLVKHMRCFLPTSSPCQLCSCLIFVMLDRSACAQGICSFAHRLFRCCLLNGSISPPFSLTVDKGRSPRHPVPPRDQMFREQTAT